MSIYSENYTKVMCGYNKILACIDSVETREQLECIPIMVENWINLADTYCDHIYYDKTNKHRKKDSSKLGEAVKEMFDDLKSSYEQCISSFEPEEYEGIFKPVKIKGLQEYSK